MARTEDREAYVAALKAELAEVLAYSRELLDEEAAEAEVSLEGVAHRGGSVSGTDDGLAVDLSGLELAFEELETDPDPTPDPTSDSAESEPEPPSEPGGSLLDDLITKISKEPGPWLFGAVVAGFVGFRLLSPSNSSKNHGEKASHVGDFPITHGSFLEAIMKTGFDLARPALRNASKEWLSRIVETRR